MKDYTENLEIEGLEVQAIRNGRKLQYPASWSPRPRPCELQINSHHTQHSSSQKPQIVPERTTPWHNHRFPTPQSKNAELARVGRARSN